MSFVVGKAKLWREQGKNNGFGAKQENLRIATSVLFFTSMALYFYGLRP